MNLRRKEPEASWSRPDVGKAKLNFDASFLIENHSGSLCCLISELNGIGGSRSAIRDTTKDIRNIVTISKINRSANKVAHELAKLGSCGVCVSFYDWFSSPLCGGSGQSRM
jgi:hypothetical protein